jgi:hypothetical protein
VQSLDEVGVDVTAETPKLIDRRLVREVDVVVTVGREAHVDPVAGTQFENWATNPPNAALTASTVCASSAMTSPPVSPTSTFA